MQVDEPTGSGERQSFVKMYCQMIINCLDSNVDQKPTCMTPDTVNLGISFDEVEHKMIGAPTNLILEDVAEVSSQHFGGGA